MLCKNCGAAMPDGQAFCTSCGAPLTDNSRSAGESGETVRPNEASVTDTIPAEPAGAEPVPAYEMPNQPAAKRGKPALIIAVAAAVVVIAVAALGFGPLRNVLSRTFLSPETYYHQIEKKALRAETAAMERPSGAAVFYRELAAYGSGASDQALQNDITFQLSRDLTDILSDSSQTDFSWLESVDVAYIADKSRDDVLGVNGSILLNKNHIADLKVVYDSETETLYAAVPEASGTYVELEVGDLLQEVISSTDDSSILQFAQSLLHGNSAENPGSVLRVMPDSDAMAKLIDRYVSIAIEDLTRVDRSSRQVTACGVSTTYTTLTVEIDETVLNTIIHDVLNQALEDEDVKDIIRDSCAKAGMGGDAIYQIFRSLVQRLLNKGDIISTDIDIRMEVFVDAMGNVRGRNITVEQNGNVVAEARFLLAVSGAKLGVDIEVNTDNVLLSVTGSGTTTITKHISCELNVSASAYSESHELGVIAVDGSVKDNFFLGEIVYTPSGELRDLMLDSLNGAPDSILDIVRNAVVFISIDGDEDHSLVTIALKCDGRDIVSAQSELQFVPSVDVNIPENTAGWFEWLFSLDKDNLKTIVNNLKAANVPNYILGELADLT
ncbi:MAG: zinc ribbon domain-containing protein [Oscillospiraceae bacterium]|nr:zinc ribbon domain-containing protein [Oscillospiraceae bacterium]